jgi:hypothetical protein
VVWNIIWLNFDHIRFVVSDFGLGEPGGDHKIPKYKTCQKSTKMTKIIHPTNSKTQPKIENYDPKN